MYTVSESIKFTVHMQNSPKYTKQSEIYKRVRNIKNKVLKNSAIQNSPKPVEFLDLNLFAPTELIYALKTQTGAIKDQRAKVETIIRMKIKGLMV